MALIEGGKKDSVPFRSSQCMYVHIENIVSFCADLSKFLLMWVERALCLVFLTRILCTVDAIVRVFELCTYVRMYLYTYVCSSKTMWRSKNTH